MRVYGRTKGWLKLVLSSAALSGCGAMSGYLESSQAWPDGYCYAALRADARLGASSEEEGLGTLRQVGVVADLPFSILADTAALPVVLAPSFIEAWKAMDPMREQATGQRLAEQSSLAGTP
jgi:uncharacterized protein YceK